MPCTHQFHKLCILKESKCPICRKDLLIAEFPKDLDDSTEGIVCEDWECGFTDDLVDENGKYLYTVFRED